MMIPHGDCLRHRKGALRKDEGQSLIEIALVLPVFFLITFGFINLCMIMFSMGNANFASRAALRYAITHSSTSYSPTTQQNLNKIVAPYIFPYPSNTYSVSVGNYLYAGYPTSNSVGTTAFVTFTISYTYKVLGHTYTPISYTTTCLGFVLQ